jgi:hypothetical protein|nr:MAG TPA: hypothetical protein [Caudoviricetes sp.]
MMILRKKSIDDIYRQAQSIKIGLAGGLHANWIPIIDKILFRYVVNIEKSAAYLRSEIATKGMAIKIGLSDMIKLKEKTNKVKVCSPIYMGLI